MQAQLLSGKPRMKLARSGGGAGSGGTGKQHARLFKRFAQGSYKQPAGGGLVGGGFTQGGVQQCRVAVKVRVVGGVAVSSVQLAARKDIGAAEYVRQAVALDQKHFQPLGAVAQHHYGGRVARGQGGYFGVEFHACHIRCVGERGGGWRAVESAL